MTSPRAGSSAQAQGPAQRVSPGSLALGVLRASRPKQWVKNLLVAAAPGAAGVLTSPEGLLDTVIAFAAFCLAASGTYLINDAADVHADRRHPRKRHRPVAAGIVPVPLARVLGAAFVVASLAVSLLAGTWKLAAVVTAYLVLTTSYTLWLKHIPVVDLVGVASGFILRALAGAAAVEVPVSSWFFIVASLGSLFIVGGKRESELRNSAADADEHGSHRGGRDTRSCLTAYSHSYLSYVRAMSSGAAVVAYGLWAVERDQLLGPPIPLFTLSTVPFLLGILRYAMLVDSGAGECPEELVLHDRALQVFGSLLIALVGLGIYAL